MDTWQGALVVRSCNKDVEIGQDTFEDKIDLETLQGFEGEIQTAAAADIHRAAADPVLEVRHDQAGVDEAFCYLEHFVVDQGQPFLEVPSQLAYCHKLSFASVGVVAVVVVFAEVLGAVDFVGAVAGAVAGAVVGAVVEVPVAVVV